MRGVKVGLAVKDIDYRQRTSSISSHIRVGSAAGVEVGAGRGLAAVKVGGNRRFLQPKQGSISKHDGTTAENRCVQHNNRTCVVYLPVFSRVEVGEASTAEGPCYFRRAGAATNGGDIG
jgi:hypothetical protein